MKLFLPSIATITIVITLLVHAAMAADPASIPSETQTNTVCPISGKPVNPAITMVYEGRT